MQQKNNLKIKKTHFLVSFKNLREISKEIIQQVDILDLKNPDVGSIGAWDKNKIKKAVSLYSGKVKISATLGDVFCNEEFEKKLDSFDKLKLDFIKFGLLAKESVDLIKKIQTISKRRYKTCLVCVVFVDLKGTLEIFKKKIHLFKKSGIDYVLLDTFSKVNGDLLSFCKISSLKEIIFSCKKNKIKVGLAGSLKKNQLPSLVKLNPNIVGFRSAVCKLNNRSSSVNINKIKSMAHYFNLFNNKAIHKAGA